MDCVGCPIAAFHSVEEAGREHGIDAHAILLKLRSVAGGA
jgi:hybrid cluster-associated redox disulfide protein